MANTLNLGNGNWATKKDFLLAYNSENGNFKPLPFDFDRASSATVVNKDGLIEVVGSGEPRIDFLNDSKGALKLEPSRSNLVTYSEDFINASWSSSTATVTANQGISLSGDLSADEITTTDDNGSIGGVLSISNDALTRTQSVFVKYISGTSQLMLRGVYVNGTSVAKFSKFDLSNGTIISTDTTAKIEDYGNGWYRVSQQITNNNTGNATFVFQIFTTNDAISTNSLLVWGAQLEQGSYATSYIPTQGQSGGVTRVADNAYQQSVTQVIGQSEGTMFIEFIPKDSSTLQILYQAKSSSGVVGQIDIRLQSGLIRALANDGGGSQFFINGGSYAVGTKYKVAIRYKLNDSKLYINGTDSGSDTSCSFTGSSLDQVSFADSLSSFLPSVDIIDSRLYNTALTDSELAALTTI